MSNSDAVAAMDHLDAMLNAGGNVDEDALRIMGHFDVECHDSAGVLLWKDSFNNLVTTIGKNSLENIGLGASGTAGNAFMGLISSTSFSAVSAADTMSSHAGWLEAGNANTPHYSGSRATMTFGAASSGTIISTGNAFVFTGSGTVQGGFIDFSTGATGTIDNTAGVLFSAGTLASAQPVISTNTLTMSYTLTLT